MYKFFSSALMFLILFCVVAAMIGTVHNITATSIPNPATANYYLSLYGGHL
jgi:hypothetical protein